MAEKLSHGDLVAKIAMNSRLTAFEVEQALDVLSSVVQDTLQKGGEVELLGIGNLSGENGSIQFKVGSSLHAVVSDPSIPVTLSPRTLTGQASLMGGIAQGKHKVNVC